MNQKQKYHVAIAYGKNIPQIAIPLDDKVSAAQTAVFLAENLQQGMTVIVDGIFIPSAKQVSYEMYTELFQGRRVGKFRHLPKNEDCLCDDDFCWNESTLQIELDGSYWELCNYHHDNLIKETGAILRHVPNGWEIDGQGSE